MSRVRRVLRHAWIPAVLLAALLALRLMPHPPLLAGVPLSTAVEAQDGRLLRLTLAVDDRYRLWTPLDQISPTLVQAVLLHEDAWFYWHPGINPLSLLRGAWSTYVTHAATIGGSTITMQLARLRWNLPTHDLRGKIVQIFRALQLEACYSKHDILEAYLNLAPYGGNIEGVGAASRIYFDKPAAALNVPEALALAVLPQAPSRRGQLEPGVAAGQAYPGDGLAEARARLYARWRALHPSDSTDALMQLPLRLRPARALPFRAPHFVEQVLQQQAGRAASGGVLRTTLDLRLQRLIERQVRQRITLERHRGLDNAAVMVLDTRNMAVRALVGSADYFDDAIQGQINGADTKRSPGSTLKPFIYALALQQGLIQPATVLRDVPSAFGPYTPENFDNRFVGPITATEALVRSRNVPAVALAARLRHPNLYGLLQQAGVADLASEQHYGLALVLGGGEVTMEELARLYAMLDNGGELRRLRWREDEPMDRGTPLLSPEASWITLDMLRQHPRPNEALASDLGRLPVAWKTGTSWGFRDAWTAGIVGRYVIVVWMGNFDATPNPALVGVDAAAPLFFDIIDALRGSGVDLSDPRPMPTNIKRVEVCLASGDLPNAWCPARGQTWFIPGVSPIRVSTVHRPVSINRKTGEVDCGPFDPARDRIQVYEFWPSDLAQVFAQAGLPRRKPPPGADCNGSTAWMGSAPQITSPYRATRYSLPANGEHDPGIALAATTDADVHTLYWFADGGYIGEARTGVALAWHPGQSGTIRVSVVDDHGRADARDVQVERR